MEKYGDRSVLGICWRCDFPKDRPGVGKPVRETQDGNPMDLENPYLGRGVLILLELNLGFSSIGHCKIVASDRLDEHNRESFANPITA